MIPANHDDEADVTVLAGCAEEPIHRPGAIQPFGFLLGLDRSLAVSWHSANAEGLCDIRADGGGPVALDQFVASESLHAIRNRLTGLRERGNSERLFGLDLFGDGRHFDVALHLSGPTIVLEAEPSAHEPAFNPALEVQRLIARLGSLRTLEELCQTAARQLRALTGFDRVMVYRFELDESGEVIAESRRSGAESFMGLHYPASDIPPQARALYCRNLLRIIPDIAAEPVALRTTDAEPSEPLDLSMSILRAVSPVHLEYLRNMGVAASLSASIVCGGGLWGLIACHHMTPYRLSFERRTAMELYARMLALLVEARMRDAEASYEERARSLHHRLMSRLASAGTPLARLSEFLAEIEAIVECDGVALSIDGHCTLRGHTPTVGEFRTLLDALPKVDGDILVINELRRFHPPADAYVDRAAGALVISISKSSSDHLVFFRREIARSVTWAGNPDKRLEPGQVRLSPRTSFAAWQETVRGQSKAWSEVDRRIAESIRVTLLEVILHLTDAAAQERLRAEERQDLLIAELNHRVRNILSLIRGLVNQSKPHGMSGEDFARVIGGRIQALARAHDQITSSHWGPGSLRSLMEAETGAYLGAKAARVRMPEQDALLEPHAFSTLALVMHELMTNSVKYGALCDSSGHVDLDWRFDICGRLCIEWREFGGPVVQAPTRRGFGSTIIERAIPFDLKGEAEIHYPMTGVQARFVIPATLVTEGVDCAPIRAEAGATTAPSAMLEGPALVVEDNMIVALEAEEILLSLGASKVELATSVRDATRAFTRERPVFALLDVNLGSETSIPLARTLLEERIPVVFATGYGGGMKLPVELEHVPVLTKPYTREMVVRIVQSVLTD